MAPQTLNKLTSLDLKNKKVFLRLDLNVPIKNGQITDDTRIRAALPTINYILENTNRVVLCSHLGRPKGVRNKDMSLEPIATRLAELLKREVIFVEEYVEGEIDAALTQLQSDQIILLENLRFYPQETKNDVEFSRILAKPFDVYVDDAFGAVHRAHASVVGVAEQLDFDRRAAGFLLAKEVEALSPLLHQPKSPFVVVMGGAKVSDKIAVILSLLEKCNQLLIGGAMAYSFLHYKGVAVGSSRIEEDQMETIATIYRTAQQRNVEIVLPIDHVAAKEFNENTPAIAIEGQEIPSGLMGLDIGPKTIEMYARKIKTAKTVLWNGPMGVFEWPAFASGTMSIAKALSETDCFSVVGGGDSVAAINKAGVADKITHVSTGGGASLEFLEGQALPGIKVLQK